MESIFKPKGSLVWHRLKSCKPYSYGTDLFDSAEFIDVSLVLFHAVLSEVKVRWVFGEFFLILGHLFNKLSEVAHCSLLFSTHHAFLFLEILQLFCHLSERGENIGSNIGGAMRKSPPFFWYETDFFFKHFFFFGVIPKEGWARPRVIPKEGWARPCHHGMALTQAIRELFA